MPAGFIRELSNSVSVRGNIVTNDSIVVIGNNPEWSGYESWNGLIDDVRIYSYALSEEEVKDLYESKEPPKGEIAGRNP